MGAESFVVRFVTPKRNAVPSNALKALAFHSSDADESGAYVRETAELIAEALVTTDGIVSLRFAVCHPRAADEAFLQLVTELAERLGSDVEVLEDMPAGSPSLF